MKRSTFIFNALLALCLLLVAGVLAVRGLEAQRMRDPDYARMLADKEHFEKVIVPGGLPMHPASYWKQVEPGTGGGEK